MPTNYIMCGRPISCRFCEHAYYGLLHMVNEARNRGFNIVDLAGLDCIGTKIYQTITKYDPLFFFGIGHGNICAYTDDNESLVFTCPNSYPGKTEMFANRIVYLWSCLTGYDCRKFPAICETICKGVGPTRCCYWDGDSCNSLGDSIIEAGALAYAGFDISWTWMLEVEPTGDPYDDKYALGFYEAGNELILALLQLKTLSEAGDQSIAKYNEWINYWRTEGAGDIRATDAIKWLVHDRDGLVLFGDLTVVLVPILDCTQFETKEECLGHGCYWYNGECHAIPLIDDSKDFTIWVANMVSMSLDNPTEDGYIQWGDYSDHEPPTITRFADDNQINFGLGRGYWYWYWWPFFPEPEWRKEWRAHKERGYVEWDISSLAGKTLTANPIFKYEGGRRNARDEKINPITEGQPSIASDEDLYNYIASGPAYVDPFVVGGNPNEEADLGASARSDLQAAMDASQPWFAIGFHANEVGNMELRTHIKTEEAIPTPPPTLYVEYK